MDAHAFAEGLRQIADWYEAHPDVALPYFERLDVFGEEDTKERAAHLIRLLGGHVTKDAPEGASWIAFSRRFNGVELRFIFGRATICERRVVRTEDVAEHVIPAHTREIVEWDCRSILANERA